jgi:type I restriction enzyme S subunit
MEFEVPEPAKFQRLGELCTITRGASPRPIIDWISNQGTPWVKISDATGEEGRYVSRTREFIRNEGRDKSVVVHPGDFIVSNSATPGLPKFMKIEACIHDGWLLFRNFRGLLPSYLYYVITNDRPALLNKGSGSVFTNLKTEILKNHEIPVPSLAIQGSIAAVLGQFDDLIELNTSIAKTLEETAQLMFRSWFIDFDVNALRSLSEEGSENSSSAEFLPENFIDSEIGPIPSGWIVKSADELFSVGIGRTPPRKEPKWFCSGEDGVPWVSIKDMGKFETFSADTNEGLTESAVEEFNVPIVPSNTVLMSFKLTVGKLCITDRPLVTNEAIAHFKVTNDSPLDTYFAYLWLSNIDMGSLDSTSSIGTATNSRVIKQIRFLVPPKRVITAFSSKVRPLFEELEIVRKQTANLIKIRNAILPRLLSGELGINEASGKI